ncbi:MAG: hypothetical protein QT10_C0012G0020 [archaeon GW2011_AR19]|nr:MAG: hypothetical protein QT10_C0012G0020 [archaeon GW2011_AR19]
MPAILNLSLIKNKLKNLFSDKKVIDIILFGSAIKGKLIPGDVDIAAILYEKPSKEFLEKINSIKGFHISVITAKEFFINSPSIIHTLIREGYSLKNKKFISENFRFSNKVMYNYVLTSLSPSNKVRLVNILRGKRGEKGIVESNNGKWVANQVFISPLNSEKIFDELFDNFKVNFNKKDVLIH